MIVSNCSKFVEEFTPEDYSVRSPRFTPDGKVLIWLQRKIGGPHAACLTLVKTSVPVSKNVSLSIIKVYIYYLIIYVSLSQPEINIVVDIVHTEEKTVNGLPFYGIYNATLLRRCWASNGRLLLSTNQKYAIKTYVIDIGMYYYTFTQHFAILCYRNQIMCRFQFIIWYYFRFRESNRLRISVW